MQSLTAFTYTLIALIAFAGNSVLCRMALKPQDAASPLIDASSFTLIRLLSGALILLIIVLFKQGKNASTTIKHSGSMLGALSLFIYAIGFSFAYIVLDTGTGALVLFGAVQITVILISLSKGAKLGALEWAGLVVAFGGFVYLVLPNISSPSWYGFLVMTIAGIAWGVYTYQGIGSASPLNDTASNFIKSLICLPLMLVLLYFFAQMNTQGVALAIMSGAVTSGLGYSIWYAALKYLTPSIAAVCQLFVPVIAALGGIIFVGEAISLRLIFSALLILGGIAMVIGYRYTQSRKLKA